MSAGKAIPYLLAAVVLVLVSAPAGAQTGSIVGHLVNARTGAPVEMAGMRVFGQDGRLAGMGFSGPGGRVVAAGVVPGVYAVEVEHIGFEPLRTEEVRVAADAATMLRLELTVRTVPLAGVTVSGSRRPERNLDSPSSTHTISAQQVAERPAVTPADHLGTTPGVDIIRSGVQSSNVVARGFNNIFSGAMYALTDHRIAGVPSLRVNLLHFVPTSNEDVERMEVVLGPGSALYGPNTASGVLHILTKSPFSRQGTQLGLSGGQQGVLHGSFRTAHLVTPGLGIKLTGQFMRADEWPHVDKTEQAERHWADANRDLWIQRVRQAEGIDSTMAEQRFLRIARRDETVRRAGGELRLDWRPMEDLTAILAVGGSHTGSAVELTALGAGQVQDWRYSYVQARMNYGRLFGQAYLNASDAGDTYLLRDGSTMVDRSRLFVAQLQHGREVGRRIDLVYGTDLIYTMPETEGTIHGRFEDDDRLTELGAFLQTTTSLRPDLDLVLTGRLDAHSHLPDPVFSPRAALLYKPADNHTLRATYNRAFSTPSPLNLFLDLGTPFPTGDAAALSQLGYSVRVQGTAEPIRIRQESGHYQMRSPFNPSGAGQLLPANSQTLWRLAVDLMQAEGVIDSGQASILKLLAPTDQTMVRTWNAGTDERGQLSDLDIPDVVQLRESTTETLEFGYKGLLHGRMLLTGDVWFSRRTDFVTPLMLQTPFLMLDSAGVHDHLHPILLRSGMSATDAADMATQAAGEIAQIPLGVVSSGDIATTSAQALMTYRNFGQVDLYGLDLSATALLTENLALSLMTSLVSADHFFSEGELITLNAPRTKAGASLAYRNRDRGTNGELRVRHSGGFPAYSGVYFATSCIREAPPLLAGECVKASTIADLTLGYRLPIPPQVTLQLSVQNLANTRYSTFAGVPEIGRLALLRLNYAF